MGLGRAFNTLVVGARVGMSFCSWRESLGLGVDSCWRELLGVLSEGVAVGGSCLVSCRRELLLEGVVCFTSWPLIFITCGWVGEASFGSRGARAGFECQRLYFCNGFFVATAFLEQRLLLAMVTVFRFGRSVCGVCFSHILALGFRKVRLIGGNLDSYFFFMSCRRYKSCASPDNFFLLILSVNQKITL